MDFLKSKSKIMIIIGVLLCLIISLSIWILADESSSITYAKIKTGYISPSGITISGSAAYVSDDTSNKVYKVNLDGNTVSNEVYSAPQPVNSVYSKGDYVYALTGGLDGNLIRLNAGTLAEDKTAETGHTPSAMVIVNDKIYVACRYSDDIYIYNESDMSFKNKISVPRQPVAITAAGSDIYVACHINDGPSNADIVSAKVSVISVDSDTVTDTIALPNGCGGVRGICVSEDGSYVYVPSIIARYTYPTTQMDRGWINTNGITIINTSDKTVMTSVLLDNVEEGAANPWGVVCSGSQLIVTIAGTNEVIVIDTAEMLSQIDNVKSGNRGALVASLDKIPNYLPFLDSSKTRIPVEGAVGLRNLAVSDGKAYICGYFTGNITVLNISDKKADTAISLGTQPENDSARKGEILWNNANLSYQKWQSCASCHPDARVDGLNWDTSNDGFGNSKNVLSAIYTHRTPPSLTIGVHPNAEDVVTKSLLYSISSSIHDDEDLVINEYLKSIPVIQSPYLNRDGSLTADALEGKDLFESEGCIKCHYGPNFTDLDKHKSSSDVTYNESWEYRNFYTPSLVETWSTGPWFASGQYKTLREAVEASLKKDSKLSSSQIDKLTAYVGSIGTIDEYYGVEQVKITADDGSLFYNTLLPGKKLYEMTVRKQLNTDKKAAVTITLYSKGGSEISSKSFTLNDMELNEYAAIPMDIDVPSDIEVGSYYVVSIVDAADNSSKLGSDLTIYYRD